jgi:exopolysaccharide production protein ExoZ
MTQRIVSLQALRFMAAAMVVAFHSSCWAMFGEGVDCPVDRGWGIGGAGVDIFFVISGFVITFTGPLASPRPTGAQFFWRRWSRVAPIFYLLSAPFIAIALATGGLNWPQTAATFLFWPAAGPDLVQPYLHAGWTLGFEMLFYTAMSLALVGGRLRRNFAILAAALALAVIASRFVAWDGLKVLANPIFVEFAAGAGLAILWPRLGAAPLTLGWAMIATGIGVIAADAVVGVGNVSWWTTLENTNVWMRVAVFGAPGALLIAGFCVCERALKGRVVSLAASLGDASYSLYLSQAFSVPAASLLWFQFLGRTHLVLTGIASFVTAVAVGVAVYRWIERPILKELRRVRWSRPQPAGAAT